MKSPESTRPRIVDSSGNPLPRPRSFRDRARTTTTRTKGIVGAVVATLAVVAGVLTNVDKIADSLLHTADNEEAEANDPLVIHHSIVAGFMGTHYSLMRETGATDSEIARVRTNLVKAYALLGLEPEEYDYYVSSDVLQSARRMHVTVTAAQTVEAHHGERAGSAVRGGSDLAVAYGLIVHVAVRA